MKASDKIDETKTPDQLDQWSCVKLKRCVQLSRSRDDEKPADREFIGLENIESWTGRRVGVGNIAETQNEDAGTSTVNLFEPGDVIFGKLRPYLAKAWLADIPGACTTEGLVLRPQDRLSGRFLVRCLLTRTFIDAVDETTFGAKMPRADWDSIGNIAIPLPPLATQRTIADFLDRETGRVDALVAAKERLLKQLAEKRRALITRAVTRGLNPDAPLRDSGLPWLGPIPKHWKTERAKWLFRERDDRSETGEEEMLTVSHLTGVTPRSEKDVNMFEAETTEGYKICHIGDLVINTLWAWMGAMGVSHVYGIVSPVYNVYTPGERLYPAYADALVRIPVFAEEATRFSKGVWSSRLRLYPEGFFEIWLPVPPLEEQRAIVAHIATERAKLDGLRAAAERTLALLKERRAALIAAAVTGKMDVSKDLLLPKQRRHP